MQKRLWIGSLGPPFHNFKTNARRQTSERFNRKVVAVAIPIADKESVSFSLLVLLCHSLTHSFTHIHIDRHREHHKQPPRKKLVRDHVNQSTTGIDGNDSSNLVPVVLARIQQILKQQQLHGEPSTTDVESRRSGDARFASEPTGRDQSCRRV